MQFAAPQESERDEHRKEKKQEFQHSHFCCSYKLFYTAKMNAAGKAAPVKQMVVVFSVFVLKGEGAWTYASRKTKTSSYISFFSKAGGRRVAGGRRCF